MGVLLMRSPLRLLGFDFGASNGRAMLGAFDGKKLSITEAHRFSNDPVWVRDTLHWDVLRLLHEMRQGIARTVQMGVTPASIGIDTWGVDFGLLDRDGCLIANPVHYRDARTEKMMDVAFQTLSRKEIFYHTGLAFMPFNSLYQLLAIQKKQPALLDHAKTFLFMPDLLAYFCTGEMGTEYTIASTSQLTDPRNRDWSAELINAFHLPQPLFTKIHEPGTIRGALSASIRNELGLSRDVPVVAGAQHDTAAAVAAVPARGKGFAYISSGTWSLLGVETGAPVVSSGVMDANYTNEGGVCGTTRVLKNIMGMWILQECRRNWWLSGVCEGYEELNALAQKEKPFRSLFDPDDSRFLPQGDMPENIRAYCAETNQPAPETHGQFARAIYESLALKYRWAVRRLERDILGHEIECLHIVGGGSKNALLNQMAANAVGKPVLAGPGEATVIGNLLTQAMALSEIDSLSALRDIVRASFETVEYLPENADQWQEAYGRFLRITGLD